MRPADDRTEAQLSRLLETERKALLAGRYDELDRLARRKADLVARLAATPGQEPALDRMRRALLRNQRLIGAALDGLRAARAAVVPGGGEPMTTYGPDGQTETCAAPGARVERRL